MNTANFGALQFRLEEARTAERIAALRCSSSTTEPGSPGFAYYAVSSFRDPIGNLQKMTFKIGATRANACCMANC